MRLLLALPLLTLAVAGCLQDGPDALDAGTDALVFHGGPVWTGDEAHPWPEAVAVVDDRIVAVGSLAEARAAAPGARLVDLEGRLLAPGLHDTHNHFLREALSGTAGAGNPFEPWQPGWDPVAGVLSQQVVASGHVGTWGQNNADRVQDGRLPAPPSLGGHAHDAGHGHAHAHADGRDAANDLGFGESWDMVVDPAYLAMAQETAARYGVTSMVEAGAPLASLSVLQDLEERGALTARYNLYVFPEDLDATLAAGLVTGDGTPHARLLGMKIYTDGWLGPRTSALSELYNDRPHQGFSFYTQEEMDGLVLRAHDGGLKLTGHTIGDRSTAAMLSAYERALAAGTCTGHVVCDDPRFTLEHVQVVPDDLLERMVALELVPSIQLSFAVSDSHWAEDALGAQRLASAGYRWNDFLERGLRVGGSSDWPIEVLPPLWGVERVVTRQEVDGSTPVFQPEQAVSLDAALRMVTIDAAYLEFREHELGSITPGKYADLVVFDGDPWSLDPAGIAETPVALTMVGGEVVYGSL